MTPDHRQDSVVWKIKQPFLERSVDISHLQHYDQMLLKSKLLEVHFSEINAAWRAIYIHISRNELQTG